MLAGTLHGRRLGVLNMVIVSPFRDLVDVHWLAGGKHEWLRRLWLPVMES